MCFGRGGMRLGHLLSPVVRAWVLPFTRFYQFFV
jgi:hypothetical protein